jgi:hypothetical protein
VASKPKKKKNDMNLKGGYLGGAEEGRAKGKCDGGVDMVEVPYMHVWKYHNETFLYNICY